MDVGKTLARLSLWTRDGTLLQREVRANAPPAPGADATLDTHGVAGWLVDGLKAFAGHPVEAIIPVAHGAAIAGIRNGELAFTPPDYEWNPPAEGLSAYRAQRDAFALTGSPQLPRGLNFGAQLHALEELLPGGFAGITLLPYAQYWAWLLSGVAVSEVTSLGCHSDLWNPVARDFSPMARRRGWDRQFAPLAAADTALGPLRSELAGATGLPQGCEIYAGLHDSNAALHAVRGFPKLSGQQLTVLSTGTWFIAMRPLADREPLPELPEARDCLVNVDVYGLPVPSARFMGGREIELLIAGEAAHQIDRSEDQTEILTALPRVLAAGAMVLPTLAPGCGPFAAGKSTWLNCPANPAERRAAIALYAALVADTTLGLIGVRGSLLIEGRFARADCFTRALAALRPSLRVFAVAGEADVSFGALRLVHTDLTPPGELIPVRPLGDDISAYRDAWRAAVDHDQQGQH